MAKLYIYKNVTVTSSEFWLRNFLENVRPFEMPTRHAPTDVILKEHRTPNFAFACDLV